MLQYQCVVLDAGERREVSMCEYIYGGPVKFLKRSTIKAVSLQVRITFDESFIVRSTGPVNIA